MSSPISPTPSAAPAVAASTPLSAPAPWQAEYAEFHSGVQRGIDAEIAAVIASISRWGGDKPVDLRNAVLDGMEGESYLYSLTLSRDVKPPEFTAVDIHIGSSIVKGFVEEVSADGYSLTVATEDTLPAFSRDAHISFDPTRMLKELRSRFDEVKPGQTHKSLPLVRKLLGFDVSAVGDEAPTHPSIAARKMTAGQQQAISRGVGSELCLVFGPPGTGKTRTLGSLVAELHARGRRVLVTAHTNTALDTAMNSVVDAVGPTVVQSGQVVRAGKLSKEFRHLKIGTRDVANRASAAVPAAVTTRLAELEQLVDALCPQLPERSVKRWQQFAAKKPINRRTASLEERLKDLIGRIGVAELPGIERPELLDARRELREMEEARQKNTSSTTLSATIVGATLSKIAMDPSSVGEFDTVVIDEGSMVMLPQAVAATLLARSQVIILGDPRQLPPVVQASSDDAKFYLGTDIFTHLGLEDPAIDDPRRPMLTEQFRMRPEIRSLVSSMSYANRLTDHQSITDAAARRNDPPKSGLILLDTSESGVTSEKRGGSRINEGHVDIVTQLVRQLAAADEHDIGVITPFRPQMQLLRQSITQELHGFFRNGGMLRTIHGSQGGEKSTIILDLVDAPPQTSMFLDDRWNTDLPRLLNVALSRAQHRLIVVAHAKSLRQRYQKSGALIMRLITRVYREGTYLQVGADRVIPRVVMDPYDQPDLGLGLEHPEAIVPTRVGVRR
jgi:hypothetical protein